MLIFSILNHPRSFLVYYYFFAVSLSYQTNSFALSFKVKVILHVAKNYLKYRDVAPVKYHFIIILLKLKYCNFYTDNTDIALSFLVTYNLAPYML